MKTYSFLNSLNLKTNKLRSSTSCDALNPLVGIDMGIPLNIIQNVFTNLHYGYDITTVKAIILQFMIGYYTYGKDRYRDALVYEEKKYDTPKKELFEYLLKYKELYKISYDVTFVLIIFILLFDENMINNIPFIFLLYSTDFYNEIKKLGEFVKPSYIAVMWTFSAAVLPAIMHDHNYSILKYPMDYLPCAMTMFSSSTILDIKDIEEDKINGVKTIPSVYGLEKSQMLTIFLLGLSSLLVGLNPNYLENPIPNSVYEFINLFLATYVFMQSNTLRLYI
tara:strand:- start:415 stop:1251 length:837 start_codon:yes stop_codon:yes gene_type:complete